MPQLIDVIEDTEEREVPEVEIRGDEAVIVIDTPEKTEERTVKLPRATWA
jgi:hypothetical protein